MESLLLPWNSNMLTYSWLTTKNQGCKFDITFVCDSLPLVTDMLISRQNPSLYISSFTLVYMTYRLLVNRTLWAKFEFYLFKNGQCDKDFRKDQHSPIRLWNTSRNCIPWSRCSSFAHGNCSKKKARKREKNGWY